MARICTVTAANGRSNRESGTASDHPSRGFGGGGDLTRSEDTKRANDAARERSSALTDAVLRIAESLCTPGQPGTSARSPGLPRRPPPE